MSEYRSAQREGTPVRRLAWPLALSFVLLLAACAGGPLLEGRAADDAARAKAAFEQQQHQRAEAAAAAGHWGEAVQRWDILVALSPDLPELRQRRADAQAHADASAGVHLRLAAQALHRGDYDLAERHFLGAMALQPENAAAAAGLRTVESERIRHHAAGRYARLTLAGQAASDAQGQGRPSSAAPPSHAPASSANR